MLKVIFNVWKGTGCLANILYIHRDAGSRGAEEAAAPSTGEGLQLQFHSDAEQNN